MSFKFEKQYRLPEFDYSSNNSYFITAVTKNRRHFFGEIKNGEFIPTEIGLFVEENFETVNQKVNHLKIVEYIIMPDHIHFLAVINHKEEREYQFAKGLQPLIKKSISSFTNQLKGTITKWCRKNNFNDFEWQSRFHDRVIRNSNEYNNVRKYIQDNIENWKKD